MSVSVRIKQLVVFLAIGILAGCSAEEEIQAPFRQVPVVVKDIIVSASAAGIIEPITTVEVKSKASGEIIQVLVEEGDDVSAGQMLVRVDPRIPRNAVVQAEADSVVASAELANAKSRYARAEALFAKQSIAEQEFEDARLAQASAYAALVRSKSAIEDALIAFEDTEVRAPSDGIILGRNVELGSVITSASRDISGGSVLLRMANLDTVQVRALIDETDIGKIKPEMAVTTIVDAYPNRKFRGRVLRIGAEAIVEQNVTMFPVLVRIDNDRRLLRPGMNAEVEVHVGSIEGALAIPNAALKSEREIVDVAVFMGLDRDSVQQQLRTNGQDDKSVERKHPDSATMAARREQRRQSGGGGGQGRPPGGGQGGRPGGGGGGQGRHPGGGESSEADDAFLFGGNYAVFVVRETQLMPVMIRTGLTDFSYVAVLDGLHETDSVLILPTAGLLEQQASWQNWARRRASGPLSSGGR